MQEGMCMTTNKPDNNDQKNTSNRPTHTSSNLLTTAQKNAISLLKNQVLSVRQQRTVNDLSHVTCQLNATCPLPQKENISFRKILGTVFRNIRVESHRTLREVSEQAGVSLGYLSEIERGQKEASSELLVSISSALGFRLSQILRLVANEVEQIENKKILQSVA